ncbi:hypothetical protein PHMEG_00025904 [Phytophthora megakarya]|uniref:Reverse transcriptase RNase H-like domain-containing protein n=1 Tax=Phytophthora megakarya TaxID=4795 RepID=A0A225VBQ6_9STRA|nr:hypothetical protein PHMEG_00025904 [Phytophthora megakarya]
MEYLGQLLSSDGVRPLDRLVTAVRESPRPSDATEVKRFEVYRCVWINHGAIDTTTQEGLRMAVAENQEFSFEWIKAELTTQPLLVYPNFNLQFRLVTDASKVGLGWQTVAYASKVNSHAESNYSITELECLAVVWSVKLFRPYLYGRSFTIITDHSALRWLMTRPNLAGRLHRWSLTLQEYEFDIQYRPGATNVVADALSRSPAAVLIAVGPRGRRREESTTTATGESRTTRTMIEADTTGDSLGSAVEISTESGTLASGMTAVTTTSTGQLNDGMGVPNSTTGGGMKGSVW